MKNAILLLILALYQYSFTQFQLWGACTQSDFTNEATALAFDASNNLYVTGYITGESAFNANVTFSSAQGNGDIYVAKYNPTGSLIWVKKFGGPMSDRAYDIKVDNNGDIVVSGQYFGTVNFGGQTLQSVSNSKDIFVIKMNPQGDVIWAISEGGSMGDNMYALAIDQQNNIILTGQFAGSMNMAGQTFNSVMNPDLNQASYDIFVSKYDSNGTAIWAMHGAAKYEDRGMALGTDNQNNIYLAGQFSDTLNFAGQTYNNSGYNVGFITKINPNGQIQWFNRMTAGMVLPYDLVVGADNQISICGDFLGNLMHHGTNGVQTLTHDYAKKVFVSTVNSSGQVQWQRALGSDSEISARGIARDANNQIYVTGHFRCALTELQQNSTALFNSVGFRDIYLWTLNAQGTALQTKQMGGRKNDYAYDIQVNGLGQPFICGSFIDNLFTPHSSNLTLVNTFNNFSLNSNLHNDYYHFPGDESANSFVSNALNQQTNNYNYFENQPSDSLNGYISPLDTIHICVSGTIGYNPLTDWIAGPEYTFLWNTGSDDQLIAVNITGDYWVNVSRVDNCVFGSDSVHVIIHQLPLLPLLSDNYPLFSNSNILTDNVYYHYCPPDTFNIWFSSLPSNVSLEINGPQTFHTDINPYPYFLEGYYSVYVEDNFCSDIGYFQIIHDSIYDKLIDPLPNFVDPNIINDTLTLCLGDWSPISVIDLLTNPQMDFSIQPTTHHILENFSIECNGTSIPVSHLNYDALFTGTITGWYVLTYTLISGYDNLCGIDTLHHQRFDSLYVIVNPLPQASTSLNLGSLLCPNGSVFITTNNVIPGLSWSGPGIDWISPNFDSIQVSASGYYSYGGQIVDPITGCTNGVVATVFLPQKVPPAVVMFPEDAIVCPYDSVLMTVPNTFVSYNWTGPSGTNLSSTNTHLDAEMGFYYCTVLDDEGCYLTTPPTEIKEYATPYLFVEPTNYICPGQQLEITAVFTGNGTVNWLSPISGNESLILVTNPGWYVAELTSCGITVLDSVQIIDGSFSPTLSALDTLLCYNQEITISGSIPNGYYIWSNGIEGANNIQISSAGTYSATVTNDFGCTAQTNQITITAVEGSAPPNSYTITLCAAGNEILTTNQNIPALWYDANMNLLDSAVTYSQFFATSTIIFAAYPQNYCPVTYATIQVNVIEPIDPNFEIIGDTLICYSGESSYSTNWAGTVSWHLNGNFLSNDSSISLNANNLNANNTLVAILENTCHSLSIETQISVSPQMPLTPSFFDTIVCPHSDVWVLFNNNLSNIYTVDFSMTGVNDSIYAFIENSPVSYQFYGFDALGCVTDTVTINFDIHVSNFEIIQVNSPVCAPDSLILTTNSGSLVNWQINQYFNTSDTVIYPIVDAGVYYYSGSYTDSMGCFHSANSYITVLSPNPLILLDTMVCIGETVYTAYDYSFDNSHIFTPIDSIQVLSSQTINYVVNNNFGCPFFGEFQIIAIDCQSDFPNVITPNGDGVNDVFVIKTAPMEPNNHLIIMNRWGNVVFEENAYKNTFIGQNCTDGVYFYTYTPNKNEPNNNLQKGFFHIISGQ